MPIEQIIQCYAEDPRLAAFAERLQRDKAFWEQANLYAIAMIWHFARAAGLPVEQVNAGLSAMAEGPREVN